MNQVSSNTGILRAQQTLNSAAYFNAGTEPSTPLGTHTYTVILTLPCATAVYCPGLGGRNGGLIIG